MGPMAMVEMEFDPRRRAFLTLGFARRNSRGGQPPRRPLAEAPSPNPEPPDWWNRVISRRTLLRAGAGFVGTGVGLFIADRLGLLYFLHPESEKRKRGRQLDNLQFNTQDGKRLEKDSFYRVGKIDLQQQTTNYNLILNQQQLVHIADKCGVNKVPEVFQIIIAERYASPNQQGHLEEKEAEVRSDGSKITLFTGLDTLFKNAAKQLDQDFEISPEGRARAQANFNVLVLNQTIVRYLCTATILSDLSRKGAPREEAEKATEQATRIADTFRDELLNGQTAPVIVVSRLSTTIF